MSKSCCNNCGAYDMPGRNIGTCRRRPPTILTGQSNSYNGYWPAVSSTDWCAEHVEIADPPKGDPNQETFQL